MASVYQLVSRAGKRVLMLRRTCHPVRQAFLQSHLCSVNEKLISSSSRALKILTESTTIIQDGVTIEELPILIRRASKDTYPFSSHSYSGDNIREESEFDTTFIEMLHNCDSVSDVFRLLEVPSDQVQGHSAVYALQRLHVLMSLNTDWQQIHSFIRKAVIGELYQIIERDVTLLSNFSLITLVDCYFAAEGFSPKCFEAIYQEISHRLVEGFFSLEELLSLVQSLKTGILGKGTRDDGNFKKRNAFEDILSENASVFLFTENSQQTETYVSNGGHTECKELLRNAWVHLASRYNDLDENTLPWTMQLLSRENKKFMFLLDKRMSHIWHRLSGETASMCLDNLVRLRSFNTSMMTNLGQWAFVNIHLMTPSVLLSFLNVCLHFSFTDSNVIQVMERCIAKSGSNTPTNLLALCIEYLRSCKYISPIVMDIAADHFVQHWESYEPLEIFAVLRNFGHFGYLPAKPQKFLFQAETCLDKRFNSMNEAHLLEVLATFTFLNVLPKNFFERVSGDYFYKKVGALRNPAKMSALMWLKVMKHAVVMGSSTADQEKHLNWVLTRKKKWSIYLFHDLDRVAIMTLKSALDKLFGRDYHHVIPFYSCCTLYLDENQIPLKISHQDGNIKFEKTPSHRLVILLRSSSHFTSNTRQLLGVQLQRLDHLKKLGFSILEIRAGEFHCQSGTDTVKKYLSKHVNFTDLKVIDMEERSMSVLEEKYLGDWIEEELSDGKEDSDDKDGHVLTSSVYNLNNKDFTISPDHDE